MEAIHFIPLLLLLALYFIPSIIALIKGKSNTTAIVVLNLFLGWSFVGWIVALVWAVSKDKEQQHIIVNNNSYSDYKAVIPTMSHPAPESGIYNSEIEKALQKRELKSVEQPAESHKEKIENLHKLKELLDGGILTQDEFNQQKKQILG